MTVALIDADSVMFQATFNVESDGELIEKFDDLINSIMVETFADEAKMAIKGENNFRYEIDPTYKDNRKANPLPDEQLRRLSVVREHALSSGAVPAEGMEADDLVAHWAYEMDSSDYVICHMDKDLDMIPGSHYNYHWNKMTHYDINYDQADRWFCQQLLMGDSADNIKCLHGIGPVKAAQIIGATGARDRMPTVISLWQRRVPDWKRKLFIAGNLLWLRRYEDDWFTFKHEGVEYGKAWYETLQEGLEQDMGAASSGRDGESVRAQGCEEHEDQQRSEEASS